VIELVSRLFASTISTIIEREGRRVVRVIAFGVAATVFLIGVTVFLIMAGFFWLRLHYPPIEAALFMAAALLVLAILCVLSLALASRRRPPRQATIAEEVAPLVDILKAAGCHSEAAGLLAGSQLAGRIRPYYLVVTAMVVGLILGRKLDPRAPSGKSRQP
jgi:MFS family permease